MSSLVVWCRNAAVVRKFTTLLLSSLSSLGSSSSLYRALLLSVIGNFKIILFTIPYAVAYEILEETGIVAANRQPVESLVERYVADSSGQADLRRWHSMDSYDESLTSPRKTNHTQCASGATCLKAYMPTWPRSPPPPDVDKLILRKQSLKLRNTTSRATQQSKVHTKWRVGRHDYQVCR
ncbi:hypothetical protein BCR34DRAFT_557415 [Clohesyomyces aquaticus]|uniref:Uncharacterized protein n=1 Tax=Clohesyomyces aquaticus TaxID=1231657 RepID=A0A1Y2A1Q5_9PLEO|nr:hypothetical protein BCR34DRAFT_557415 [Clohesyomyces aquaticus]